MNEWRPMQEIERRKEVLLLLPSFDGYPQGVWVGFQDWCLRDLQPVHTYVKTPLMRGDMKFSVNVPHPIGWMEIPPNG